MDLRTLEHCTPAEITEVFNHAFSDYIVPLKMTEEAMVDKMKSENIQLALSAGAFDNDTLVGFILHGYDVLNQMKTVYNAGTGVIPSWRGRSLTEALYNFIIPKLQEEGILNHVLEVITTNDRAIRVYEKMGFIKQRELGIFKKTGSLQNKRSIVIQPDRFLSPGFISCEPSWQNNTASIMRNGNGHEFLTAYDGMEIVGFAAYVPSTGRVKQLAVHQNHRRKGIGTALVSYMMENKSSDALTFTNVDLNYAAGISFFEHLGFQQPLSQFEMILQQRS